MPKYSRRRMIQLAAMLAAVPLTGCERVISKVTRELGQSIPENIEVKPTDSRHPVFHLLSRATFGVWPGDLEYALGLGEEKWLAEQLDPSTIDDILCDLRARRFESIHFDPSFCYEFKKEVLRSDLVRHRLLRAIYSKRQLLEVMVDFWTDHLNISTEKGDCIYLKATDERKVIRPNAFGKFQDLIKASALSPAMLIYLDGNENKKATPKDVPNENYARELLELHTLGVNGGYTQQDVSEAARCLTGWTLHNGPRRGEAHFDPALHDNGEKRVLGQVIPAGQGEKDLDSIVAIACKHPSTARYISKKLVHRFVSDSPPDSLVTKVTAEFTRTNGDIKSLLKMVLLSDEFRTAQNNKLKRPFHYIASCLRTTGADTHAHQGLVDYLERMGHSPYQYPTPDGYPDEEAPWAGTLLWRWNFALALVSNQVPSVFVNVDRLTTALHVNNSDADAQRMLAYFLGRNGTQAEIDSLKDFVRTSKSDRHVNAELIGLILASPAFQRC